MVEPISKIILLSSFIGIVVILLRKIPVLVKLPEVPREIPEPIGLKIKNRIKNLPGARSFNYELYLQKVLSKIRILTLKTENKTGSWLEKLRQKTNQKNSQKNDHYWEELKKAKNGK